MKTIYDFRTACHHRSDLDYPIAARLDSGGLYVQQDHLFFEAKADTTRSLT